MRRAVIIGGPPMLLRSDGVAGVNDAMLSSRKGPCKFACMPGGRGCTGGLLNKSIAQKEEMQGAGGFTAASGHSAMEWQWVIARAAAVLPGWCWAHSAIHTVDAAWVTSTASSSCTVIAGRMRRPAEWKERLTTALGYAISTLNAVLATERGAPIHLRL
jgi:hypothetical protein